MPTFVCMTCKTFSLNEEPPPPATVQRSCCGAVECAEHGGAWTCPWCGETDGGQ